MSLTAPLPRHRIRCLSIFPASTTGVSIVIRNFLSFLWFLTILTLTLGYHVGSPAVAAHPNILLILVDDMGYGDPGFIGHCLRQSNNDHPLRPVEVDPRTRLRRFFQTAQNRTPIRRSPRSTLQSQRRFQRIEQPLSRPSRHRQAYVIRAFAHPHCREKPTLTRLDEVDSSAERPDDHSLSFR